MIWSLKKKKSVFADLQNSEELQGDLNSLLEQCKQHLAEYDEDLITKAFQFCVESHKNKVRKSGDPYYKHPLAVAHIVISEIPLDQVSVICALLHDLPEYSEKYRLKDIRSEFGQTIADIVEGMAKIQYIEEKEVESNENYRKLLLSLFKDVRIILIKIAEMIHNIRTISFLEIEEQIKLAKEALEIYSPFASRFGLGSLKWELEDISFSIVNPEEYNRIKSKVHLTRHQREDYIKNFINQVKTLLGQNEFFNKNNIKFEVFGRAKHIYSIYNKEKIRNLPMEQFNDLFAIRVIIDSDDINYCYLAYGMISSVFELIPGTFKNYLAHPKKNGYRSLHSAVLGPGANPVEVQIRTREMHEVSEKGVAAHFNYKRGELPAQSVMDEGSIEDWLNLVRNVFENVGSGKTEELLQNLKKVWHQDEVYVFTPDKTFKVFPKDSTPIDYAYAIHEDIGNSCIGAKVNGKIVPLNYKLQSSDQIEILRSTNSSPSAEWLNMVVTTKAKSAINKYLKNKKINDIEKGVRIWEAFLSKNDFHLSEKKMNKIIHSLDLKSTDDFYVLIANGQLDEVLSLNYVKSLIFEKNTKQDKSNKKEKADSDDSLKIDLIPLTGIQNKQIKYATCCHPVLGDNIIAVMSSDGKNLEIHRTKCHFIRSLVKSNANNIFSLDWELIKNGDYEVKLKILSEFIEPNNTLLAEITPILSNFDKITLLGINFKSTEDGFEGLLTLSVPNLDYLNEVRKALSKISGIKSVSRHLEHN